MHNMKVFNTEIPNNCECFPLCKHIANHIFIKAFNITQVQINLKDIMHFFLYKFQIFKNSFVKTKLVVCNTI